MTDRDENADAALIESFNMGFARCIVTEGDGVDERSALDIGNASLVPNRNILPCEKSIGHTARSAKLIAPDDQFDR